MTLGYLDSKISQYNTVANSITVSTGETGDSFRSINFSGTFFTETADNFTTSFAVEADKGNLTKTDATCTDTNCSSCSDVECYTCKDTYYLVAGICKNETGNQEYFLSPGYTTAGGAESDIQLAAVTIANKTFTLSFFMKFFSKNSSGNSIDVLRIGTNLKIRLVYNTVDTTVKLQLYSDKTSECTIAEVANFLPRFGLWTNISLAFYYDSTKLTYYPANLNFQVDFTPLVTDYSCYNKDQGGIASLVIEFPKESIALYANVLVWDKYFTGVWGYQSMATAPTGMSPTSTSLLTSKITQTGKTVNHYRDFNNILVTSKYCTPDAAFYNGTSCLAKQSKCPYGYFTDSATSIYCSCENKEEKTWIVNKTDTRHYCQGNFKIFYFLLIISNRLC